jgi:predicted Zn finger-like uncharacterized protein
MSERSQALSRARCPACGTVFRVTSEQLRLKAGKVRCGQCQKVFNAFDHIQLDSTAPSAVAGTLATATFAPVAASPNDLSHSGIATEVDTTMPPAANATLPDTPDQPVEAIPADQPLEPFVPEGPVSEVATPVLLDDCSLPETSSGPAPVTETLEETTQAAREAGLVAVRELNDTTTTFNRWSAGALASDGLDDFGSTTAKTPLWPYLLFLVLLLLVLFGQLAHYYRTGIVQRLPATAAAYGLLGVDVPLPRTAALVSIETSDLQLDNVRGLFVLNATLKNRAPYAQAWPSLELTLTDVSDRVIARRVIAATDYLPSDAPGSAFAANADIAVRLWIDASGVGAAGYRLYIFYP